MAGAGHTPAIPFLQSFHASIHGRGHALRRQSTGGGQRFRHVGDRLATEPFVKREHQPPLDQIVERRGPLLADAESYRGPRQTDPANQTSLGGPTTAALPDRRRAGSKQADRVLRDLGGISPQHVCLLSEVTTCRHDCVSRGSHARPRQRPLPRRAPHRHVERREYRGGDSLRQAAAGGELAAHDRPQRERRIVMPNDQMTAGDTPR